MSSQTSRMSRPLPELLKQQDAFAGLVVIAVAAFAFYEALPLSIGTLGGMGAGMLPKSLAVLLGLLGAALFVNATFERGATLERWSVRGPVLVLGAVLVFGLTVRPLGLSVAGPLAVVIGAFASEDVRWKEAVVFAVAMTALCIALFKFALGLPIPLAPWLLGY